jgi:hypothetical protein
LVRGTLRGAKKTEKPSPLVKDSSAVKSESSSMASAGGVGSAVGKSYFPLARGFPERLEVCFLALITDDLAVALELPEVALGAPLRREAEEDFVMVGDEKKGEEKRHGGTSAEVCV